VEEEIREGEEGALARRRLYPLRGKN